MRITDSRYQRHRRSIDLAWRLIGLEARTSTISRWTGLSGHRIRALYRSYVSRQDGVSKRHRGMSPYRLDVILHSPQKKCEAAMFAALCRALRVLPEHPATDVERSLPSVQRGEMLCEAYEWFRYDVPDAQLTLEQGILLVLELARGEHVQLGACPTCEGVMLIDPLSVGYQECVFCATDDHRLLKLAAARVNGCH